MAMQHAAISIGEVPSSQEELEDQIEDMWYNFAIPDFENSSLFENLSITKVIKETGLQDAYKQAMFEALTRKYNLSF